MRLVDGDLHLLDRWLGQAAVRQPLGQGLDQPYRRVTRQRDDPVRDRGVVGRE